MNDQNNNVSPQTGGSGLLLRALFQPKAVFADLAYISQTTATINAAGAASLSVPVCTASWKTTIQATVEVTQ